MAETSAIEWTDATWNIVTGCSVVSPACTNCYAMRLAGTRLKHHPSRAGLTREVNGKPVWTGEVRFNDEWLPDPMKWKRPRKIFVAAHGDLFHDAVPDAWIDRVFAIMALAHWHTFQVLTKRSARMRAYLSAPGVRDRIVSTAQALERAGKVRACFFAFPWPLSNIWLGVTVEDQQRADERIPDLLATPAAVRFVSCEPLLGGIDFRHISLGESGDTLDALYPGVAHRRGLHNEYRPRESSHAGLDLVIAGGESGPGARSTPIALFRSLRDQCAVAGVAFDFKQWGEWIDADQFLALVAPERVAAGPLTFVGAAKLGVDCLAPCEHHSDGSSSLRVGKRRAGRALDGREHNEFPETRR